MKNFNQMIIRRNASQIKEKSFL